ncbi:uncharacterized protein NECHADRAFT_104871 [Fusarium vanettenii 77-13-4]|uniref:Uncharacterized protein n=1 Tax=Fusarium vanettenii (strain ATCC MYA-4622 / CBS 123669 / FGSC 9596 / NRRL 45880 / 77-13-4) TaxID=660122 RepID=C7ZAH5_FUSV7|nr:uncharacterized protein NECHADRAFT_104871 [Fusarium vanettenii 77-13-4]EEU39678.1 hypothetical protein NECHADRAFT_104871 [Fusarium vanettenii 77-13-4]
MQVLLTGSDYKDYTHDPSFPWPHGFIIQDLVKAFALVAMFFPKAEASTLVTQFIKSKQCDEFRNSLLFDPKERSKTLPDRRSRASYKFRDPAFWNEWNEFLKTKSFFADVYPFDWSLAVRPIVARLYVAGVVAPAYIQNDSQVVLGMATAKAEPHRPGKLDLFINYEDRYGNFPMVFPPSFVHPSKWPHVLPTAESFAKKNEGARYALIRLWSAPHFYPLMDMPGSEYSAHHTTERRLKLLEKQFEGHVMSRADLILVMGKDDDELLKYCTAVTFAIQTKPWLREIDLWKSFINVDLEFLQGLDPYWLD